MKKKIAFTALFIFLLLSSCTSVSAPQTYVATEFRNLNQSSSPTVLPSSTSTFTATLAITNTTTITLSPTITVTRTITPTPLTKALCPVDLSTKDVYISAFWGPSHMGIDIAGPYGTKHMSPDDCYFDEIFIDQEGNQGILLICPRLKKLYGIEKIELGHVDFSYENYDSLNWYGIPIETFFENNIPKKGLIIAKPTLHSSVKRGDDLHIYMACTGNCGFTHTHITVWTMINKNLFANNDPLLYIECEE